jgi:hypothetical protein
MELITLKELETWWPPTYGSHEFEVVADGEHSISVHDLFRDCVAQLSRRTGNPDGPSGVSLNSAAWQFGEPWLGSVVIDVVRDRIRIVFTAS